MAKLDFLLQGYNAETITKDEIQQLAAAALGKITGGAGDVKQLAGWGIGGKNFQFLSDMTPSDLYEACNYALIRINRRAGTGLQFVQFDSR